MIRFPNFEPDRSDYALDATTMLVNAAPVKDGWGPVPDIVAISDALGAACLGAVYARTSSGAYRLIAGTASALYELESDYSWTDVTGSTTPAVPAGDRWSFAQFGPNLVAVNLGTVPQALDLDSGTDFADLSGSPPTARYAWVAGEHLVLGHHTSFPNRLQVSGIGDAAFWTLNERGCDLQDFPDGEEIMGGIGSEKGALIFHRTMIRQMVLQPSGAYSFATQVVNPSRGVVAPLSIAQIGPGQFFYYSQDGFFLGAEGKPIGAERVDRWFSQQIEPTKIGEIRSVADPFEKIVWTQAEKPDGDKFLLGYDWQLDRWCYADNNVSEMCVMVTPGVSWDGLGSLYTTIDDIDVPFDSALFSGGLVRFAAFNTSNELCFFTGEPRAATLETSDLEFNPGFRSFLQELRVYTDCTDFTIEVGTRDFHGDPITWCNPVTPFSTTKACHFRSNGRLHRIRMNIAEGMNWNHVIGLEEKVRREGQR